MALVSLVLAQLGWLLALAATAWAAGWAVWGRRQPERLLHPLTLCLGLGLLGEGGLLLAALHLFRPLPLAALALLSHAAAAAGWRQLFARALAALRASPARALTVLLVAAIAGAGGFAIALYPPTAFDETTYHLPLARAFLATGGLPWVPELRVPTFPVLAESLQAALLAAGGDRAPHQVALLATLATAALLLLWGREAEDETAGWIAAALFLGSPLVAYLAGTGYVDPVVGLFATGSFYALWRARDGGVSWPWIAGCLAGMAAATKYLGLYCAIVGALVTLLVGSSRWRRFCAFAGGTTLAMAVAYGNLLWRTGNPVFPFFTSVFRVSRWEAAVPGWIPGRAPILMLPFDAVFRRELVGEQPPLSPAVLLGMALLAVALVRQPRLRIGALVVAGFFATYMVMPVVSRYLLTVLPLLCLLAGVALVWLWRELRGAAPSRLLAAVLAVGLALPGPLYGWFYVTRRHGVPASPAERESYLASTHPGYGALAWLQGRQGGRYVALCLACEHLHGLARGRLLGEHFGPWAYYRFRPLLADPPALQRRLRAIGVEYLLLPRDEAVPLHQSATAGRLELLHADTEFEVWRVCQISTCMPSSTTRLGGRLK